MTNKEKSRVSRAFGRHFIVFDKNGEEYATIKGRLLSHALQDAKECGGEIWLDGRCTVPSWNV